MSDTKNDIAWNKLFEKYAISQNIQKTGYYLINSSNINEFREARLMTKFDYKSQLPEIISKNNYSILPISRGGYIISDFETFKDFESDETEINKRDFPGFLESIDYDNISSEATALNCAYVTGITEDFVQEQVKPTVSGRMSSLAFNFNINTKSKPISIDVKNSQIEIDGGYEGANSLCLIEAKNSISKDFLIRQLYYPFRLWNEKVSKRVRPIFLTYSNGIFHFREYLFEDPINYNSIKLIREKKYAIRDGAINVDLIQHLSEQVEIVREPEVPFPQADSFERIINLCELLNFKEELNREDITHNYDFNARQTNYYTDAGRYLGLIDKKNENREVSYFLTRKGKRLFDLSIADRQEKFIELILSHSAFNKTLKLYFKKGESPSKNEIVEIMKNSDLYKVDSESTFQRRASTILSWNNWILDQIEE